MAVAGLVKRRKHQFARQPERGTIVAATRAYPYKGVPTPDLGWTDPDVDAGAIAIVAPPVREAPDLSSPLTDNSVKYNNVVQMLSAILGGQVSPTGGGTAKTWAWDPDMEDSATYEPDYYTYEFGDDVETDWFQFGDSHLESLEITSPERGGALTASMTWRHGTIASTGSTDSPVTGTVPTPGLTVDTDDIIIYAKDIAFYIADTFAGLGSTPGHGSQVADALHTFVLRITKEYDDKFFQSGTQSFDVDDLSVTGYNIELEATWAKVAAIVGVGSEADDWMADNAVNRFLRFKATSTVEAQGGTPYSWMGSLPARYYTRTDGESGGNATVTLMARAFWDGTRIFPTTVVNTLTDAELGTIGS